jgi:hypothetical protein
MQFDQLKRREFGAHPDRAHGCGRTAEGAAGIPASQSVRRGTHGPLVRFFGMSPCGGGALSERVSVLPASIPMPYARNERLHGWVMRPALAGTRSWIRTPDAPGLLISVAIHESVRQSPTRFRRSREEGDFVNGRG